MILNIEKRTTALGEKYEVFDEKKNKVYTARSKAFSNTLKLSVYDEHDEELVYVTKKEMSKSNLYEIEINGSSYAKMQEKKTWHKLAVEVEGEHGKFTITGDFLEDYYSITLDGVAFGMIHRNAIGWHDGYTLTIDTDEHIELFVAVVLVLGDMLENE